MLRRCPICERDSIVGHGWRRKQAHDEKHDWIPIRRGLCHDCGKSFTLLPCFSLPYTHYSLLARVQALHQRFVEGRCWDRVAPVLKDPQRVADPASLRRWFAHPAGSTPPVSQLRRVLAVVSQRLSPPERAGCPAWPSSWLALVLFLPPQWSWPPAAVRKGRPTHHPCLGSSAVSP
jgi:Domain of unknown function (DUF6431)